MRIPCPPGQLVADGSLWDHHVKPQELVDGGVTSVIMGLYQGNWAMANTLNDNCKRICDHTCRRWPPHHAGILLFLS